MTDCNMTGYQVATIIHCCFKPNIDVYVTDPNEDVVYSGKAADVPANLYNLRVTDMYYDDYNCIFFVEVK